MEEIALNHTLNDIKPCFAKALRHHRKRRGIKQEDFAGQMGLSRVTISRYEGGKVEPDVSVAIKMAKALGFSLDELK